MHTFTPRREEEPDHLPPTEAPVVKLFSSADGQWLASINYFGDIYIFNLETQRCDTRTSICCYLFAALSHFSIKTVAQLVNPWLT